MKIFKRIDKRQGLAALVGICLGVGILSALSYLAGAPVLIASFGASSVFLYAVPTSPMARKSSVICGHVMAACCGVAAYALLGDTWYAVTLALLAATFLMLVTGMIHPPAGATAIIAVVSHMGPLFIIAPVLVGALVLVGVSYLTDRIAPQGTIPVKSDTSGAMTVRALRPKNNPGDKA